MVISRMKHLDEPTLIICLQMTHTHYCSCLLLSPCLIIKIIRQRGEWDLKVFPCTRRLRFTTLSPCKGWDQVSSLMTVLQGSQNTFPGLGISDNAFTSSSFFPCSFQLGSVLSACCLSTLLQLLQEHNPAHTLPQKYQYNIT